MAKKLTLKECYQNFSAREIKKIKKLTNEGYVVFYDINWDTDGEQVRLPKAVRVPKIDFEADFDFSLEGADYLSDKYGFCIHDFSFKV